MIGRRIKVVRLCGSILMTLVSVPTVSAASADPVSEFMVRCAVPLMRGEPVLVDGLVATSAEALQMEPDPAADYFLSSDNSYWLSVLRLMGIPVACAITPVSPVPANSVHAGFGAATARLGIADLTRCGLSPSGGGELWETAAGSSGVKPVGIFLQTDATDGVTMLSAGLLTTETFCAAGAD